MDATDNRIFQVDNKGKNGFTSLYFKSEDQIC